MFKLFLLLAGLTQVALSISTLSVKGAKFFVDNQQFFIKGEECQSEREM